MRNFEQTIYKMSKGEKVYINSIALTVKNIETLKNMIKSNILIPDKSEVEYVYKDVESVMNGDVIIPQMTYIKKQ